MCMPTMYTVTRPVARKQHRCCECRQPIEPKEQYVRTDGMWDGRFDVFKTCMFCYTANASALGFIREDYFLQDPPFGELWAWFADNGLAERIPC